MTQSTDHSTTTGTAISEALFAAARAWLAEDPDPATRTELSDLLEAAESGDSVAYGYLEDRFDGRLQFGTAGLRGELGAGPNRMNRVTVLRAAAGLAAFVTEEHGTGQVVAIGYDARHNSRRFAEDTAEVMLGAGHRPYLMPRELPTPMLAYSVLALGAKAGVMVTASHNPARDNGYKVYLGDGSQITTPNDTLIAAKIDAVGALADVPRGAVEDVEAVPEDVIEAYIARSAQLLPDAPNLDLTYVYTAMHGVGFELFRRVLTNAGFREPISVPEQQKPDPDFPTVSFPNPEEPGALDLAFALAAEHGADVIIANDPDADRMALAVPDKAAPSGWRRLSGDDVGLLLGHYLATTGRRGTFATSIVSSEGLAAIAADAAVDYARTLTGFKWLSKVPDLAFGYEEAIGYCVDPSHVRDKDGITAALTTAVMVAALKADGRTLLDYLAEVDRITGNLVTTQLSIRSNDPDQIQTMMRTLRQNPPSDLGGVPVTEVGDLSADGKPLPPEQGLRLALDGGWIAVRPSGTEPKLKCYIELGDRAAADRAPVVERIAAVRAELDEWFGQFA
ncbi:phosphoglucomutase/phosphomannomutase alpha/beta/alpha domain I [Catenulispora acidiphila DSM 44928]|uniref:Phosphoglucomutase/phosphomannomutase alpha/beta/alpha domain I n=1 Tax=Catenulispora acidiphila (strain DSM 44928 / JCM 14897 / NBRC 102108 / NRRL B-24433 / ID139908) TaxID=479433 RepID=C7Q0W0_CATAD|nr:phospho-sugar mutase [Catenulispora acidiphila]ACU69738.1 phosphoglucomutase/phosphomannomutase alpha/beta/alpha domain I [Catenulispora acidiphila DSM 44928]